MTPDLQQKLFAEYPRIFRRPGAQASRDDDGLEPEPEGPIDQRGVECGDGWHQLVAAVAAACEADIEHLVARGEDVLAWPRICQIKEKFGVLVVSISGITSAETVAIHDDAVRRSQTTCELCGQPGERRTTEWVRTTCAACEAKSESTAESTAESKSMAESKAQCRKLREILAARPDFVSTELRERMQQDLVGQTRELLKQVGESLERCAGADDTRYVKLLELGDKLSPTAVFDGTQLPAMELFQALAAGQSLAEFCAEHPELPPGSAALVVLRAGRLLEDTAV